MFVIKKEIEQFLYMGLLKMKNLHYLKKNYMPLRNLLNFFLA